MYRGMSKVNKVTEILEIEKPIIQAPMSYITTAEMVAAVSNAGGLGVLGPHAGRTQIPLNSNEIIEQLRSQIKKTKQLTDKPFGVNFNLSPGSLENHPISKKILEVCLEEHVKILVVVGALNCNVIIKLKKLGFTIIYSESNSTIEGARMAEAAGADIIVATGYEAGGNVPNHQIGTMTIVPIISDAVKVPVIAAGGIIDKRSINAAFALGADGVYIGTRFMVATESPTHDSTKRMILKLASEELITIKTPYGWLRSIPNNLALEASRGDSIINGKAFKEGLLDGELKKGLITVSNAVEQIKEIKSCKEIIDDLAEGLNTTNMIINYKELIS